MRLWIAGLLALALLGALGSKAVVAAPHKSRAVKTASMTYVCPACGVGAVHAAACPVCKTGMGRLATYACMKCQISTDRPGICPNCREPMKSVLAQYRLCSRCGFFYSRAKKACPVCTRRHRLARR